MHLTELDQDLEAARVVAQIHRQLPSYRSEDFLAAFRFSEDAASRMLGVAPTARRSGEPVSMPAEVATGAGPVVVFDPGTPVFWNVKEQGQDHVRKRLSVGR